MSLDQIGNGTIYGRSIGQTSTNESVIPRVTTSSMSSGDFVDVKGNVGNIEVMKR